VAEPRQHVTDRELEFSRVRRQRGTCHQTHLETH
jgi:hypothetical protein